MQNNKELNFYDDIVENLKKEAKELNTKLSKVRNSNDMNSYIATLKSLRETLDLIKKYDWNLYYSEYTTNDKTQVTVWEQNQDGQIRNHKVWDVAYF